MTGVEYVYACRRNRFRFGLLLSAESCGSRERLATVEPRYKDTQHKDILNIRIILKILDPNLDFLV
jgi:hypothetical protein